MTACSRDDTPPYDDEPERRCIAPGCDLTAVDHSRWCDSHLRQLLTAFGQTPSRTREANPLTRPTGRLTNTALRAKPNDGWSGGR
jgi:hypothetical protein